MPVHFESENRPGQDFDWSLELTGQGSNRREVVRVAIPQCDGHRLRTSQKRPGLGRGIRTFPPPPEYLIVTGSPAVTEAGVDVKASVVD